MLNSVTKERVSTSHSLQVLSPEAVNNCLPSGFQATYRYQYVFDYNLLQIIRHILITSYYIEVRLRTP